LTPSEASWEKISELGEADVTALVVPEAGPEACPEAYLRSISLGNQDWMQTKKN
jgi:hypothetical protein